MRWTPSSEFCAPIDELAPCTLDVDGFGVTFIEPLSPEMVDMIRSSAHRLIVTLQFVTDDEQVGFDR